MDWQNMLAFYERSADDESTPPEQRLLFARKANWLRVISRLHATGRKVSRLHDLESGRRVNEDDSESLLFSPVRLRGDVRPLADETCRKLINKQSWMCTIHSSRVNARNHTDLFACLSVRTAMMFDRR